MRYDLIHPVDVVFAPLSVVTHDDRAREAIKGVNRSASVTLQGQQHWLSKNRRNMTQAGDAPETQVRITTRRWVLDDAGYEPSKGDKITSIADKTGLALYVSSTELDGEVGTENELFIIEATSLKPAR